MPCSLPTLQCYLPPGYPTLKLQGLGQDPFLPGLAGPQAKKYNKDTTDQLEFVLVSAEIRKFNYCVPVVLFKVSVF